MAWDHPISQGRLAALHDEAFWFPMLGIVSRIAERCGLEAEQAGDLITSGMAKGEIGHRIEGTAAWIVAPRGAELARRAGLSYEASLDWSKGCLTLPGGKPQAVSIFWPDVERAVRNLSPPPSAALRTDKAEAASLSVRTKRGPRPELFDSVCNRMRAELAASITPKMLAEEKEEALAEMFGVSRKTAKRARDHVLAELSQIGTETVAIRN